MRFDNAFLTASKKVGMQMVENGITFSAYRDKHNKLHVSEHATDAQWNKIADLYVKLEKKYSPKEKDSFYEQRWPNAETH